MMQVCPKENEMFSHEPLMLYLCRESVFGECELFTMVIEM